MTKRGQTHFSALLLLAAANSYGQQFAVTAPHRQSPPESVHGFSAPVLGYVVDGAGAVRKMPGLAGASWLTAPLDFGVRLAAGVVSPRQDYILGLAAPDRRAILLPAARLLSGVDPGADRVVVSPGGSAAAFYFSQTASLEIVTGLLEAGRALHVAHGKSVPVMANRRSGADCYCLTG